MHIKKIVLTAAISMLAACATETTVPADADPITQAIAGKRLITDRGDYVDVGSDGSLSGMVGPNQDVALKGAWVIRDGQFCRTLSKPADFVGTECQDAVLNEDGSAITITGRNGPISWSIE